MILLPWKRPFDAYVRVSFGSKEEIAHVYYSYGGWLCTLNNHRIGTATTRQFGMKLTDELLIERGYKLLTKDNLALLLL